MPYNSTQPLQYREDGMEKALIQRDIVYNADGLKLDLYAPPAATAPTPAVIIVHGDGPIDDLPHVKNWQVYEDWARLLTVCGFTAVVFHHRTSEHFAPRR